MHIDFSKCKISESTGQRRHDAWPLYRFYIKYHLDLFSKWRHFHSQIQIKLLVLIFFHSIFPSCTVPASVCLSICGWEICRIICQKRHFKMVLFWNAEVQHLIWNTCRSEGIFSYSLGIAGELFHIPANIHSLILIRPLWVRYSKIKYVQENSKMECLLKLFHWVNWLSISKQIYVIVSVIQSMNVLHRAY